MFLAKVSLNTNVNFASEVVLNEIFVEDSIFRFYIDRQTVVNGANGHLIMRQYLAPFSDNGGLKF